MSKECRDAHRYLDIRLLFAFQSGSILGILFGIVVTMEGTMLRRSLKFIALLVTGLVVTTLPIKQADSVSTTQYWIKIKAADKYERSLVANTGVSIEAIREDYVYAYGNLQELKQLEELNLVEVSFPVTEAMDFPEKDREFHNYAEMKSALEKMHAENPEVTELFSIGKSIQGRDILGIRISGDLKNASQLPGIIIMGGHHAREHVSVELPIRFAQHYLTELKNGNPRVFKQLHSRDIHIIPAINPDGMEYDIEGGKYKTWRKNRKQNKQGTYGVDLNRNYGFKWGTGGSSNDSSSDVYMGEHPFSEPETQAVKAYVEKNQNLTVLLSVHTFSQLILYPWGHTYDPIQDSKAREVHEKMAREMAQWNGYKPQQSSELYIASGDTTDWSYGEHKIISFTFELDPANNGMGAGGFYPGQGVIPSVVQKNIEPILYLIDYADNPYRVLDTSIESKL